MISGLTSILKVRRKLRKSPLTYYLVSQQIVQAASNFLHYGSVIKRNKSLKMVLLRNGSVQTC